MIQPTASMRRLTSRLGFRFAFLLAMALLPLGVISVLQARAMMREASARSEAALLGATLRAVSTEASVIDEARGVTSALAEVALELAADEAGCIGRMRGIKERQPHFAVVGYVQVDGLMRCASTGEPFDFSGREIFSRIVASPEPQVFLNPRSPLAGTAIIGVTHPVFAPGGAYTGFISVSIPHDTLTLPALEESQALDASPRPRAIFTFDEAGVMLTSSLSENEVEPQLPRDRALAALRGPEPLTFTAVSRSGQLRSYSVVPLVAGQVHVMASWAAGRGSVLERVFAIPPVIFPLLMLLASLVVAWLAAHYLVIRHIGTLRKSIGGFASGRRVVTRLDVGGAPLEIREMAETYERMTDTILHDEAELEDTIHQKEVLLREVHHRVKNNLQLIASIMSMQIRQARSQEARELMRGLQERVMSLATIHRGLYQTSGLTDVRADELFPDIVGQIIALSSGPGREFEVTAEIADMRLTPDQAVPLALLATEALTNAIKHGRAPPGGRPALRIRLLKLGDDMARLEVENSVHDGGTPAMHSDDGPGLGVQLLAAFAAQLNGRVERDLSDNCYRLAINFPLQSLSESEERNASPGEVAPA